LRPIKELEADLISMEGGATGEQTLTSLTMCEEIEGLLKINMNKVNDEHLFKKPNILGDESSKMFTQSR
jgi:hypothetical protein